MSHKAWKMLYTILIHSFIYTYQRIHSFAALTRFVFYNLPQLLNKNHTCEFFMKLYIFFISFIISQGILVLEDPLDRQRCLKDLQKDEFHLSTKHFGAMYSRVVNPFIP